MLIGFGGHAKSVADSVERQNKYTIIGYIDKEDKHSKYKYLGTDEYLEKLYINGIKNAVICIGFLGKGDIRERLYYRLKKIGFNLPIIIDPTAIVANSAVVEEGTFIGKNSIINAEAKIERCCIINTGAVVEHECVVEEFSHIAVNSILCGQVKVGKACLIGANATIIQCITIPERTKIPAGKTVRIK